MAQRARHRSMRARQRERGLAVVERRAFPLRGGVADGTVLGESRGDMIRIRSLFEIGEMAGSAIRGCSHKFVVGVALDALDPLVSAGQYERSLAVIEAGAHPLRRCRMACFASCRETRSRVTRIIRFVEIGQVTGRAVCRRR